MSYELPRPHIPAETRRLVMTEAGHRCIVQHCIEHIVEIHHIDENRENNDPNNLAVLCGKHHKLAHEKKISRLELKRYKEMLSNSDRGYLVQSSEHDHRLINKINEIFPYETILLIKNEHFGSFVKNEVIFPFYELFHHTEDPIFKFTDKYLESLRLEIVDKGYKLIRHFGQQSAGLNGGYEYICLDEVRRKNPEMVEYWRKYSADTVELAQDFCASMLKLRAELINYA